MRNLIRSTVVASVVVLVTAMGPLTVAEAAQQDQAAAGVRHPAGWLCRITRIC